MRTHNDDSFAIGEAAAYLGVAPHTLRAWTREGRAVATRTAGGHRRYRQADLDELLGAATSAALRRTTGSTSPSQSVATGDPAPEARGGPSLLAQVGELFESLQPDEIVKAIAGLLSETLACDSVAVSRYDEADDAVTTLMDTTAARAASQGSVRYPLAEYPTTSAVLLEHSAVVVNASDPAADPAEVALLTTDGHVSALLLPLVFHGTTVGLVELYDDRMARAYSKEELALARSLCGLAAVALTNAGRLDELSTQNEEQQLLLQTGRAISASVDLDETLKTIARLLTETLHVAWADIYLYRPDRQALEVAAFYQIEGTAPADDWVGSLQPVSTWAEWESCIRTQEPVAWYRDDVALTAQQIDDLGPWGETATLTVAMVSQGETIGLLDVAEYRSSRRFSEDDLRLTMAIADQAAIAISNARLFEEARRRNAELVTLVRSAEALAATTEPQDTLRALLRVLSDAVPVGLLEFCEFHAEDRTIVAVAREARKRLAPEESVDVYEIDRSPEIAAAIDERRTVVVYADDDDLSEESRAEMRILHEQAALAIPMLSLGEVVGLVYLVSHAPGRRFSDDELRLATAIAAQSATAVENSRAYAREQAEKDRLAVLNRRLNALVAVSGQMRGLMDEDELLVNLGHVMSETLRFNEWAAYVYEPDEGHYRVAVDHSFDPELEAAARERTIPARIIDDLIGVATVVSSSFFVDHRNHTWTDEENAYLPGADLGERPDEEWQTDDSLLVPMLGTNDEVIGYLEAYDPEDRQRPTEELVHLLEVFAAKAAASIELTRLHQQLERQAITDGLTGLYNHRYLEEALDHEVASALRYGTALSVLMIDIDDFKPFNDTYGHPQGDKLLRQIAEILERQTREKVDIVCRYGGEEFCVVLPSTATDGAECVAGRLRESIAAGPPPAASVAEAIRRATEVETFESYPSRRDAHITVSVGVASLPRHGRTAAELLAHADKALYMSKRSGKNRVSVFQE